MNEVYRVCYKHQQSDLDSCLSEHCRDSCEKIRKTTIQTFSVKRTTQITDDNISVGYKKRTTTQVVD